MLYTILGLNYQISKRQQRKICQFNKILSILNYCRKISIFFHGNGSRSACHAFTPDRGVWMFRTEERSAGIHKDTTTISASSTTTAVLSALCKLLHLGDKNRLFLESFDFHDH
jgi:hypothetical protein